MKDIILAEVKESINRNLTTPKLRQIILSIVEESLEIHYGDYSDRCLQSSYAIKKLLSDFGIYSEMYKGAACFMTVSGNNPYFSGPMSGFWDDDFHIWVMTSFYEIIDLTISKFHLRPCVFEENLHPIPAIWWAPCDETPNVFKYLPDGVLEEENILLPADEAEDFDEFKRVLDGVIKGFSKIRNFEILSGIESVSEMYLHNHWVTGVSIFSQGEVEYPEWILKREQELLRQSK